jgi:hypothetical protein
LEAEANIMAEEYRIILTDLAIISDPMQKVLIEKKENMITDRDV